VEVDVRGPLDDPERLQLTARSDPPGLSEQRILSLLGRGQVLAAIARGDDPARVFREQLGDILTAQVLPGLLAPLETGIAEAFDLEQFTLDYTGLRPASLYLVKNLFDGVGNRLSAWDWRGGQRVSSAPLLPPTVSESPAAAAARRLRLRTHGQPIRVY
jgi:hypothetical protein